MVGFLSFFSSEERSKEEYDRSRIDPFSRLKPSFYQQGHRHSFVCVPFCWLIRISRSEFRVQNSSFRIRESGPLYFTTSTLLATPLLPRRLISTSTFNLPYLTYRTNATSFARVFRPSFEITTTILFPYQLNHAQSDHFSRLRKDFIFLSPYRI